MLVSEMIAQLQAHMDEVGDVEVLVTDGFRAQCYRGDFEVDIFIDVDGYTSIDIGIGGCGE